MTTPAYQRKRAGMISGLLQTSEYAREFLHLACGPLNYGEDEIDRMVAKRMQRQQVLYQPAKRVQVVMLEGALRACVWGIGVNAGVFPRGHGELGGLVAAHLVAAPLVAAHPGGRLTGVQECVDVGGLEQPVRAGSHRDHRRGRAGSILVRMRAAALFCSALMRSSPFAEVAGSV